VGQGYTFVDGVLLEYSNGGDRETSVLITETVKFRILRFFLDGEQAGHDQVVWKDLPGMPDGLDRDSRGRIWVSLLKKRSNFVNWVHKHPFIKPLVMRIPQKWLPEGKDTGIIAFSSDCSKVLYHTMHKGTAIDNISVVVPGSERIYLPRFDRGSKGLYSMKNPLD
jgi:sugar lactone lactonase YvrE